MGPAAGILQKVDSIYVVSPTGGHIDFKQKCVNPTVGCGMSESPNPQNSTDPSQIPQIRKFSVEQ